MQSLSHLKHSPLKWGSSLYFAMGSPFVVLHMVSAVLYKELGISDAQIAFWTSLIMFGVAALSLQLPLFFAVSVVVFAVVAFSGATHDITADGV